MVGIEREEEAGGGREGKIGKEMEREERGIEMERVVNREREIKREKKLQMGEERERE